MANRETKEAEPALITARQIYAGMGALELTDIAASLAYSDASSSLAYVSYILGRTADSAAYGQDSYVLANKILLLRPDHLVALQQRAWAKESTARLAGESGLVHAAIADQHRALEDYDRLLQLDPSNTTVFENFIVASTSLSSLFYEIGKLDQSRRVAEEIDLRVRRFGKRRGRLDGGAIRNALNLAEIYNQTGRQVPAASQLANAQAIYDKTFSQQPGASQIYFHSLIVDQAAVLALSDGRPAEAAEMLRAEIETHRRSQFAQAALVVERDHWLMYLEGKALYDMGDYPASEKILRRASAFLATTETFQSPLARRNSARIAAAYAMALAALRRDAEARAVLRPVIGQWRAEQRSGTERVWVNYDLANALMVLALASEGPDRTAALAEAGSLLARLPAELQHLKDVQACRERIARLGGAGVPP